MKRTANQRTGLARALSKRGHCSRSQAVELIRGGRVCVNGRRISDPEFPMESEKTLIEVDGQPVAHAEKIYLMMNKPRGAVTTASDERGRATVYSYLPKSLPWIAPVGRLDKASEGLLLFTNDSNWGASIASPESGITKTYHVQIATIGDEQLLMRLKNGIRDERELLRAKSARVIRTGTKTSWLEVVLDEGRNRHIRRMFAAMGIDVLRLIRIAIGALQLGTLAKGGIRQLTQEEAAQLSARNTKRA